MKKLLSVILATAMIMSLFCAVPVSAEDAVENKVEYLDAYFFEDFEDSVKYYQLSVMNAASNEIVDADTANGSAKMLKITFPATANEVGFRVNLRTPNVTFPANTVLKLSFRYRFETAQTGFPSIHAFTAGGSNTKDNGYATIQNKDANWHAMEVDVRGFAGEITPVSFRALFNSVAVNSVLYIDDVEFKIEKYAGREVFNMGPHVYSLSAMYAQDAGAKYATDDPADNTNMTYRVAPTTAANFANTRFYGVSTVANGDKVQVSAKVYVENVTEAGYPNNIEWGMTMRNATAVGTVVMGDTNTTSQHITADAEGNAYAGLAPTKRDTTKNIHGATPGVWEKLTWNEYTVSNVAAAAAGKFQLQLSPQLPAAVGGQIALHIDDVAINVNRANYEYPIVTNASAKMSKDGVVSVQYNYAVNNRETAGGNYTVLKVKTATGAVIASKIGATNVTVPEAYRNQPLKVELTPLANNGIFGDDTITVDVAAPITVTALKNAAGKQISIAAATTITNAKLIIVAYDATTNKMLDKYITTVNMGENRESATTINKDFVGDNLVYKAMLWVDDNSTFVPLTDVLAYDPN